MSSEWRTEETSTSAGWLGGNYPIVENECRPRRGLPRYWGQALSQGIAVIERPANNSQSPEVYAGKRRVVQDQSRWEAPDFLYSIGCVHRASGAAEGVVKENLGPGSSNCFH